MTSQIARKVVQSFHQPQPEKPEPQGLTPREQDVLKLLSHGDYYKEIADALGVSGHTVRHSCSQHLREAPRALPRTSHRQVHDSPAVTITPGH